MIWLALIVIGALILLFIHDKKQTKEPFLRRFPVLGWGRRILVELGPFLRQYWFANDREETPYNRITRNWVYRTSKGERNTIGFGSQQDMDAVGSIVFLPTTFTNEATHLGDEVGHAFRRIIGGRGDVMPVPLQNFVYISAMSYGALSEMALTK